MAPLILLLLALAQPVQEEWADLPQVAGEAEATALGRTLLAADVDCSGAPDLVAADAAAVHVWFDPFAADLQLAEPDWSVDGAPGFGAALAWLPAEPCGSLFVGSPTDGAGAVHRFDAPLDDEDGAWLGEGDGDGFGSSLAVLTDLAGDPLHLVVGEPAWSHPDSLPFFPDRRGRLHVYAPDLGVPTRLHGASGDRLGTALAPLLDGLLLAGTTTHREAYALDLREACLPEAELEGPCRLGTAAGATAVALPDGHPWGGSVFGDPTAGVDAGAASFLALDPSHRTLDGVEFAFVGENSSDGRLGASLATGDVTGDGVADLVLASPGWSDGEATVQDAIGPGAGAAWIVDGCSYGPDCAPPASDVVVADTAARLLFGRQTDGGAGLRVAVVGDVVVLGAPLLDHPAWGADAGAILAWAADDDRDGFAADDCDDADPAVRPGAAEVCNGVDDDCDGALPDDEADADADGFAICEGDCDDADATASPAKAEVACTNVDEDCDGVLDPSEADADEDGWTVCAGDCDDTTAGVHPDRVELCDGVDQDCDGPIDEDFDLDGDGLPGGPTCAELPDIDCDDSDPTQSVECVDSGWPGGIACSTAPGRASLLALLLLPLLLRRRNPSLLLAAVVVPVDDLPVLAVGQAGDGLPGELLTMPLDGEDHEALLLSSPAHVAERGVFGNAERRGVVYAFTRAPGAPGYPDEGVALTDADRLCEASALGRDGDALAVGDFDGDGSVEVAVGAPDTSSLSIFPQSLFGVAGARCDDVFALVDGGDFGTALAAADVDGDGRDELFVGDTTSNLWTGAVSIYRGADPFEPADPDVWIGGSIDNPIRRAGAHVAAVDWTCDGAPDLFTGSTGNALLMLPHDGAVWDGVTGFSTQSTVLLGQDESTALSPIHAIPDVDGDGCDDVLLGLAAGGAERSGEVVIALGSPGYTGQIPVEGFAHVRLRGETADDLAGADVLPVWWTPPAVATGRPDLVVGMPAASIGTPARRAGAVAFVASASIPWGGGADHIVDLATWVAEASFTDDFFGAELASWHDRDGDGLADVVVGAPGFDHPDAGENSGAVFELRSSWFADADGDGALAAVDCDEDAAAVFPGAPEGCDGLDTDCDGAIPEAEIDGDGDGAPACAGDCAPDDVTRAPGRPEGCDGLDTDCDGAVPDGEIDDDGDGLPECAGDCDDDDPMRSPLGVERFCDGVDEDCDGQIDEGFDADADGTTACGGDCDDVDPRRAPTFEELPFNGIDEDCDGADDTSIPPGCSCAASGTRRPATAAAIAGLLVGLFRRRRQRGTDESFDAL